MSEYARRFGFSLKAHHDFGLPRELMVQHFNREALGMKARVARLVDATHATLTDHAQYFVRAVEQLPHDRIFVVGCVCERSRIAGTDAKIRGVSRTARRTDPWIDGRLANL
jgi:hypothetical protein